MLEYPDELKSRSVLTDNVYAQLGTRDLKYNKGSFIVNKILLESEFNFYGNYHYNNRPQGGCGLITFSTLSNGIERAKEQNKPYPIGWPLQHIEIGRDWCFHRGHILAFELFANCKNPEIRVRNYNLDNMFTQTFWANVGNHDGTRFGFNQTYYENQIVSDLQEKKNLKVSYKVNLIYNKSLDLIPSGVHLMALYHDIDKQLNIFIPNVDTRFIVNYEGGGIVNGTF